MDLLEFGMENEKSKSTVKKALAHAALAVEKKKADLYEQYLEKNVSLPEDDSDVMLQKIREQIKEEK